MIKLDSKIVINEEVASAPNLVDRLTKEDLQKIGSLVFDGYTRDKISRFKWEKRNEAAMDLAMQVQKEKNFPWPGSANVVFPLVTIAALQFSSRSYPNLIQGLDVVKYRTVGIDPDERLVQRADRISKHMSWQVLEEDKGWEEQHDRLLINVGIVGTAFIKSYFSSSKTYSVSELVMARDLVLDYYAKSVEECARKTQVITLYRNEIYERCVGKTFRDVRNEPWFNEAPAMPPTDSRGEQDNRNGMNLTANDEDSPFRFYEQHRLLDLDGDGYAEPYIVTMEEQSKCVVKIAARWESETDVERLYKEIRRIRSTEYFTKYGFIPAPDGSIYDLGFGTLLGPLNESVNSGINQLLDSGTMSNSNGGFLGRGAKIRGGVYTMAPWEWKRVDSTGDDLRKSLVPLPVREPSDVMFKLLGLLIEYTDRIAGTTDSMVGVSPGQNTPAETSRNTTEQGMKVYSGIFKRIWRSMKEEFKKRHQLNAQFLESRRRFGNSGAYITQEDYKSDPDLVVPAADPNLVSDSQRLQQATAILQASASIPGFNREEATKRWLRALKVDSIETLYPGPDKVPALPNPKQQVEEMKLKAVMLKIEADKQKWLGTLLAQQRKTQAEIVKIYAEVSKLLAETQTEQVRVKIEAFTAVVDAYETQHDMLMQQIQAISGGKDGGGEGNGEAMGGVAKPAGDAASVQLPQGSGGGSQGPMGGGTVPN